MMTKLRNRFSFVFWGVVLTALTSEIGIDAVAKPKSHSTKTARSQGTKQVFELSKSEQKSNCLGASGVAAYVVSASGSNRGLLLRHIESGFAANVGIQPGDVLLSVNNRVIQTGADADRVLESTAAGPGRVVFVHPTEAGLQLYNAQVTIPTFTSHVMSPITGSGPGSSGSGQDSKHASTGAAESMASLESYMVELVNHDRSANGSPQISVNSTLTQLARSHAKDMATRNFFSHGNPDGANPETRARSAGVRAGVFENILFQGSFESLQSQVKNAESTMMSEPKNQQNHRSNILDPGHACLGIGIVRASNGRLYMVQEFCHENP